jgi:hypothetical protein
MNITNEEIVERVMRMGCEHRAGVPVDKLWDLSTKQIKKCRTQITPIIPAFSFNDWKTSIRPYAFMTINGVPQLVIIDDTIHVSLISWKTPTIPEVEIFK